MNNLKNKIFDFLIHSKKRQFFNYKQIAEILGYKNYQRYIAKILSQNISPEIPCHRVIYKNGEVGGYFGHKNWDYIKSAKLLAEGAVGVIPTDTIYGICASAFNKKSVELVYKLRKRNPTKPCIILINSVNDLKRFDIELNRKQKKLLQEIWPSKISVILKCNSEKFKYLHRGKNTLAFRLPSKKLILEILKISGPLIAPSANLEGFISSQNISQAKKYFKNKVFYLNRGKLTSKPSTLIDLTKNKIQLIRKGADFNKIKNFI
ncbi:MAG: L-threonylcarbamoyladenylate synthase [Patescibacteria group bacterium]|nr:L-threonylcarbamoyladenylate synthase [Patescibacteria group bacterium]MDW8279556.1 L-threonylcarbamoyladenylate synthase [bacterium]